MNPEAIIKRLKEVLEYYSLTSSTFADSIEVQRSSISHLMSGRNKPSLDFVMKVVDKYPDVDLYWLLNGQGEFPKQEKTIETTTPTSNSSSMDLFTTQEVKEEKKEEKIVETEKIVEKPSFSESSENTINDNLVEKKSNTRFSANGKKLLKVILLYDDGSFDAYDS